MLITTCGAAPGCPPAGAGAGVCCPLTTTPIDAADTRTTQSPVRTESSAAHNVEPDPRTYNLEPDRRTRRTPRTRRTRRTRRIPPCLQSSSSPNPSSAERRQCSPRPPCGVSSLRRRKPRSPQPRALPARAMRSSARSSTAANLYAALPSGGVLARYGVGHDGIDKATRHRGRDSLHQHAGCAPPVGGRTDDAADPGRRQALRARLDRHARKQMDAETRCRAAGKDAGRSSAAARSDAPPRTLRRPVSACASSATAGLPLRRMVTRSSTRSRPTSARRCRGADYVSLHIPALPENANFINETRLAQLPKHAWLINTARGAVVDERALYDAVAAERIGGAALDVFAKEPYEPAVPGKDLRTLSARRARPAHRQQHRRGERPDGRARAAECRARRARRFRGDGSAQPRGRCRTSANLAPLDGQTVLPLPSP